MPPDPPREQGPPGLATPTQINATPTSKTVENPVFYNTPALTFIFENIFHYIGFFFAQNGGCISKKKQDNN